MTYKKVLQLITNTMPSYMKSTLSQMAIISLAWVLIFAWYSVVTGREINLPDWIVATVSSIISSYVQSRNNGTKDIDASKVPDNKINELKNESIEGDKPNLHDINNILDVG